MRHLTILVGLLVFLAAPLRAQDATPDAVPPVVAPDAAAPMPQIDRKRALAARLAGLVGFANVACADVRGDSELLQGTVRRLGVDPGDLDRGELGMLAQSYLETYRKDVPANCKRAIETFGASSTIVPNLIVRR